MLTTTSSQVRNISGYLSGLSSPSVTEQTIARASSPTRNSAGQTRFPTFSITSRSISSSGSAGSAERTMLASRWHSPPNPGSVLSWVTGQMQMGEPVGVERALDVALENAGADSVELGERPLEQCGLARLPGRSSG